jgi:hypothetical protein
VIQQGRISLRSAPYDTVIKFNFAKEIERILDDERDPVDRAVRTFQLHVAVLCCNELVRKRRSLTILVSERVLQEARLFALMRLAEHGIAEAHSAAKGRVPEPHNKSGGGPRVGQKTVTELLIGILLPMTEFIRGGGWRLSPPLPGVSAFDVMLSRRIAELNLVSQILDLSLRVDRTRLKARQTAGSRRSIMVMSSTTLLGRKYSESKLRRDLRTFKPVAILGYLFLFHDRSISLSLLEADFVSNLLRVSADRDGWRRLLSDHELLRKMLKERGYKRLRPIQASGLGELPPPEVTLQPLSQELQTAMVESDIA